MHGCDGTTPSTATSALDIERFADVDGVSASAAHSGCACSCGGSGDRYSSSCRVSAVCVTYTERDKSTIGRSPYHSRDSGV
jgi:hypothetical protein